MKDKCTVSVFQWHKHTFHQCKVQCTLFEQYNSMISWCQCTWVGGHMKRPKVESRQYITLIAHLQKISPPALLHEPSPPLASVCLCSNVLSQPLELMYAVHWYA